MIYDLAMNFFETSEMYGDCEIEYREARRGNFYEPGELETYFYHYKILMKAPINNITDTLAEDEVIKIFKDELDLTNNGYFEEYFGEDLEDFLNSFRLLPKEIYDIEICSYDIYKETGYLNLKLYVCVQGGEF